MKIIYVKGGEFGTGHFIRSMRARQYLNNIELFNLEEIDNVKELKQEKVVFDVPDNIIYFDSYYQNIKNITTVAATTVSFSKVVEADFYVLPWFLRSYSNLNILAGGLDAFLISDTFFYKEKREKRYDYLISIGGSDVPNYTVKLLTSFSKSKYKGKIAVVLGSGWNEKKKKELFAFTEKIDLEVYENIVEEEMKKLILESKLIFSNAGLTMIESALLDSNILALPQNNLELINLVLFSKEYSYIEPILKLNLSQDYFDCLVKRVEKKKFVKNKKNDLREKIKPASAIWQRIYEC